MTAPAVSSSTKSMPDSAKAVGQSISFKPVAIYAKAKEWGADQKPPLNPSAVITQATREFLERRGVKIEDVTEVGAADAQAVELLRELIRKDGAAAVIQKLEALGAVTAETAGAPAS